MSILEKKDQDTSTQKITIIDLDPRLGKLIGGFHKYVERKTIDKDIAESAEKVFLLSPQSELKRISPFLRTLNRRKHLQGLFIRQENNSAWLPAILADANVRAVRHMMPYSTNTLPKRVINAWLNGEQADTIAMATIQDDELLVETCSFEFLRVSLSNIPELASSSPPEREDFKVSTAGGHIHWRRLDLHLDLEGIRTILDPGLAKAAEEQRLLQDQSYGRAVAVLREARGLRQEDIEGLSGRQVRRIETGECSASAKAMLHLAKAHGLEPNDYMRKIAAKILEFHKTAAPV